MGVSNWWPSSISELISRMEMRLHAPVTRGYIFLLGALRVVNAASPQSINQRKISSGSQGKPNYTARINVSRNFSARALLALWIKKHIFFDVDIVVENKSKCGLSWSVLLWTTSTRHNSFPKHFFVLFLHVWEESLRKFLKGKSDAYK